MMKKITPLVDFQRIETFWDPKVVAEFNGQEMRLARLKGEFIWHSHKDEDEVFVVIEGELEIEFRDQTVALSGGDVLVIPRGVEHRPIARNEVKVMLIEPASTINTGEVTSHLTKKTLDKI
ncbi:cupin domain-containing protein [Pirellulaceae bacterium]|jgi:mannose-6-phosphate isomerase-like protein (cupin superfamily)|nr:cupin domain-containing protein [Pirellulaceae bacterium]